MAQCFILLTNHFFVYFFSPSYLSLSHLPGAHDDGDDGIRERLEELLRDVIHAVGVFESQHEFVIACQHVHARRVRVLWATQIAASGWKQGGFVNGVAPIELDLTLV